MFVIGGDGGGQLADILFDSYSVFLWPNCSQTPRPAWYLGLSLQWKNTVSARSVTTVSCLGDYCRNTIMIVHVKSLPTHHHYGIIYYNGSLVRLWHHHCHQFIVCRRFPLFWIKCTSSSNDSLCSFTVIWAVTVCSKQLASHSSTWRWWLSISGDEGKLNVLMLRNCWVVQPVDFEQVSTTWLFALPPGSSLVSEIHHKEAFFLVVLMQTCHTLWDVWLNEMGLSSAVMKSWCDPCDRGLDCKTFCSSFHVCIYLFVCKYCPFLQVLENLGKAQ